MQSIPSRWQTLATLFPTAVIFFLLFKERSAGLNYPLFTLIYVAILLQRYGWRGLSLPARATLLGTVLAALMVVVHNSTIAMVATITGLCISSALAHEARIRSVWYALPQFFTAVIKLPKVAWLGTGDVLHGDARPKVRWSIWSLAILPVIIGLVFMQLYRVGNPRFDQVAASFFGITFEWLGELITGIFTANTLFFLYALAVCAVLLRRTAPDWISRLELQWSDVLLRRKVRRPTWLVPLSMNALDRELRMGLILLVLVNALLLVVNIIDIQWVWFGFEVPEGFSLKQFVHEGTWVLILSILLSMVVLLYLFRNNLNFHPRSERLKQLGQLWVLQNLVLGFSVFLRNHHYMAFHGLAYKRIGVIVFLVLVLVGLFTLFRKIRSCKSFFHLVRVNSMVAFFSLVLLTTVDWDVLIVRTNLQHPNAGEIDIDNYLDMNDHVLPLIYADLSKVEQQIHQHQRNEVRWVDQLDPYVFNKQLDQRKARFQRRMAEQRWQEWNWADHRTAQRLAAQ
ncbi:MAG: DUF4173 domain-containing protein [Flavobacteriales bacterium]|nr:DUF4173 domain-containing protein [Flavobacteriales bacterium]